MVLHMLKKTILCSVLLSKTFSIPEEAQKKLKEIEHLEFELAEKTREYNELLKNPKAVFRKSHPSMEERISDLEKRVQSLEHNKNQHPSPFLDADPQYLQAKKMLDSAIMFLDKNDTDEAKKRLDIAIKSFNIIIVNDPDSTLFHLACLKKGEALLILSSIGQDHHDDLAQAKESFQKALTGPLHISQKVDALLGLAKVHFLSGDIHQKDLIIKQITNLNVNLMAEQKKSLEFLKSNQNKK
jgi:hypothetical protein